jgi:hypothetical protein
VRKQSSILSSQSNYEPSTDGQEIGEIMDRGMERKEEGEREEGFHKPWINFT